MMQVSSEEASVVIEKERRDHIRDKVGKVQHVGLPEKRIHLEDELFDPQDRNIKEVKNKNNRISSLTTRYLF